MKKIYTFQNTKANIDFNCLSFIMKVYDFKEVEQ